MYQFYVCAWAFWQGYAEVESERIKPKFHLACHVMLPLDMTQRIRRAWHVEGVELCRDVTWRAKWNFGFSFTK